MTQAFELKRKALADKESQEADDLLAQAEQLGGLSAAEAAALALS